MRIYQTVFKVQHGVEAGDKLANGVVARQSASDNSKFSQRFITDQLSGILFNRKGLTFSFCVLSVYGLYISARGLVFSLR